MSDWSLAVPERLNQEIAALAPEARRAVYAAFRRLVMDPSSGRLEPVAGAELRRTTTEPLSGGDQVTIMYRVHQAQSLIEIVWIISGP